MSFNELYDKYSSRETLNVSNKEFYTDKNSIPNANAFDDFTRNAEFNQEYYLVCLNVDLSKVNQEEGYASGNRTLRKVYLALAGMNVYVFRIHGEKFNVLATKDKLQEVKEFLDRKNDKYNIFYGICENPYSSVSAADAIAEGVRLMYEDKARKIGKKSGSTSDNLMGNKPNTPEELRETDFVKHRNTMWYSVARITITKPEFSEFKLYIFPTDFRQPLESLPLIVVLDNMLDYRVFTGNNIEIIENGAVINVNARFNAESQLITGVFPSRECSAKIEFLEKNEGICVPANFGKRVNGGEIYPIKQNINGVCDYVFYKDGKAKLDKTGLVDIDGKKYGVYMDNTSIRLSEQ